MLKWEIEAHPSQRASSEKTVTQCTRCYSVAGVRAALTAHSTVNAAANVCRFGAEFGGSGRRESFFAMAAAY
jgi:hypothetical protein